MDDIGETEKSHCVGCRDLEVAAMNEVAFLRESTINVDVVNDVVTLKGTVENAAQKTKAEQVAKDIDGVKSVKNELKVAPEDSMTNTSSGNSNKR